MNYHEVVDYIQNASLHGAKKNNLENITELMSRLGNPQNHLKFIHVAGTNGKGSTCAMLESIMRYSGHKTGLFTSPYLEKFTERIKINGENVDEDLFCETAKRIIIISKQMVTDGLNHPTFFELVTACAFLIFYELDIEICIIEVGIGGLYDTTNIIDPDLSVICSIGLDHISILGATIEEIAHQKAGIIKSGCPVVIYPQESNLAYAELLYTAKKNNAPVYLVRDAKVFIQKSGLAGQDFSISYQNINMDLEINLIGKNQILNAATVFVACLVLKEVLGYSFSYESIKLGFKNTIWPGRFEIIQKNNPMIIIDGAHNVQAAINLRKEIKLLIPNTKCVLLCGIMANKDVEGICNELSKISNNVVTCSPLPTRFVPQNELAEIFEKSVDSVYKENTVPLAFAKALELAKKNNIPLIVAGSLYLAGQVRTLFNNI